MKAEGSLRRRWVERTKAGTGPAFVSPTLYKSVKDGAPGVCGWDKGGPPAWVKDGRPARYVTAIIYSPESEVRSRPRTSEPGTNSQVSTSGS